MHLCRPKIMHVLSLAAIAMTAVACSAATPAPSVASPAGVTSSGAVASAPAGVKTSADPGSPPGDVAAACDAMVTVNADQPPGTDPDGPAPSAQELTAWAAQVESPLSIAANNTPPELSGSFSVLTAAVDGAKAGTPVDTEDPALLAALATINASAYDHCGFQTLAAVNDKGALSGIPAKLAAGPVAIKFTNAADPATASFVLLIARIKDGQTATLADVLAGSADLATVGDVLAAATPTGDGPAFATARLTPGHYVVASPLGSPPQFSGFIGGEFDVA